MARVSTRASCGTGSWPRRGPPRGGRVGTPRRRHVRASRGRTGQDQQLHAPGHERDHQLRPLGDDHRAYPSATSSSRPGHRCRPVRRRLDAVEIEVMDAKKPLVAVARVKVGDATSVRHPSAAAQALDEAGLARAQVPVQSRITSPPLQDQPATRAASARVPAPSATVAADDERGGESGRLRRRTCRCPSSVPGQRGVMTAKGQIISSRLMPPCWKLSRYRRSYSWKLVGYTR